jgi:hypothetical protein
MFFGRLCHVYLKLCLKYVLNSFFVLALGVFSVESKTVKKNSKKYISDKFSELVYKGYFTHYK